MSGKRSGISVAAFLLLVLAVAAPSASARAAARAATCTGTWIRQSSPNPGRLSDSLGGVAAISPTDAWAVGFYQMSGNGPTLTLVEHWDGTAWTQFPSPSPGTFNELNGVTASSSTDVWAVGFQSTDSVSTTLVEHWDGISWSVSPSQNPSSTFNQLIGVSALSPTDVWAVGVDITSVQATLTEHWDGVGWTVFPSPNPSLTGLNGLHAVTMVSSNDVWAVGGFQTPGGGSNTLILNWDGANWNIASNPTGPASNLNAVAAVSADDLWAVGSDPGAGFRIRSRAEHWDGTSWTQVRTPSSQRSGLLSGTAFLSSSEGWAVGYREDPNTGVRQTLIETWDGATWALTPSPNHSTQTSELLGGAAAAPGTAWAVGTYTDSAGRARTLVETFC